MPSFSGPDRSKNQPSKPMTASKGLDESLENAPVARREANVVLPPPAPGIDFTKSAEENIKDLAVELEAEYRAEGGFQVAFKSTANFQHDAFDHYSKRLENYNANYTAEQQDADYEDHLDHEGHC